MIEKIFWATIMFFVLAGTPCWAKSDKRVYSEWPKYKAYVIWTLKKHKTMSRFKGSHIWRTKGTWFEMVYCHLVVGNQYPRAERQQCNLKFPASTQGLAGRCVVEGYRQVEDAHKWMKKYCPPQKTIRKR